MHGEVVEVTTRVGCGTVRLRVWGVNQLGVRTCEGQAVVLLPVPPATLVGTEAIVALGSEPIGDMRR